MEPNAGSQDLIPNQDIFLLRFPPELLTAICSFVPNSDIKNLRRTCSRVCKAVELRLNRVFLSPNPLNISVFRAVADHDVFRLAVREIIYDDARLHTTWLKSAHKGQAEVTSAAGDLQEEEMFASAERRARMRQLQLAHGAAAAAAGVPPPRLSAASEAERLARAERAAKHWFRARSQQNTDNLKARRGADSVLLPQHVRRAQRLAAQPSWQQCWARYARLAEQQVSVMDDDGDGRALAYGLSRFANLERVTVTPATHGFLYTPLYETPMIRALPPGFNYPMPRGWPFIRCVSIAETSPWEPVEDYTRAEVEKMKQRWRGLLLVLKTLAAWATTPQKEATAAAAAAAVLPELVIDVQTLNSGLNPHMFAQPSAEYAHWLAILAQPGFRRLDLPLLFGGLVAEKWAPLTNGYFWDLLAKAPDLESFRLTSDGGDNASTLHPPAGGGGRRRGCRHCPLTKMLPLRRWRNLRHFGLSRVPVQIDDLLATLAALSGSLRSVELSFLHFTDSKRGGYRKLLVEIKDRLGWQNLSPPYRPKVLIGVPQLSEHQLGRGVWFSSAVSGFLYGNEPNPFALWEDRVQYGVGLVRDVFDPDFERPNVNSAGMVKLGLYNEPDPVQQEATRPGRVAISQ